MILGAVNASIEAILRLTVLGTNAKQKEVDGVIDTGFSSDLTLPTEVIESLELEWLCREVGVMANGREEFFDVFAGTILWDGKPCEVEISAAETMPLVGMNLLLGHSLKSDVVGGGSVEILPLLRSST